MRIVLLSGNGIIAPHVIDDYKQAFEALQHDVLLVKIHKGFNNTDYQNMLDFKPDIVLGYGFVGILKSSDGHFLLRESNIPVVCLHYDNPLFVLDEQFEQEFIQYPEYYYHFVWDKHCQELLQGRGVLNVHPIMLATNEKKFYVHPYALQEEGTLAFVGSLGESQFRKEESLEQMFINYVIKEKLNNFDQPLHEICQAAEQLTQFQAVQAVRQQQPLLFYKYIYYSIHAQGSSIYRNNILSNLSGVDLHVYGASQQTGHPSSIIYHEPVPYAHLSATYQQYAVNLNISSLQLETSVNNRVFDVFASGAFVLSDYKTDMDIVFPGVSEEISFHDLEDLVIKADYFLTHPEQRIELTMAIREHILNHHTYVHRAQEIMSCLQLVAI
ncbi:glycosyltransferase [Paenibacillus hunanensis]|uniref:CgeB family protein n=1 Tax=Paenibacillus hunanensis TaxID=539262 RepID=UPI002A69E2C7|nr:glycosyltransferase [Paenibacillus hunanensis]WPP41202.1 glycosyltransferase [Paenibacillus hunanensis]